MEKFYAICIIPVRCSYIVAYTWSHCWLPLPNKSDLTLNFFETSSAEENVPCEFIAVLGTIYTHSCRLQFGPIIYSFFCAN